MSTSADSAAAAPTDFQRRLPNLLTMTRVLLAAAFFAILTPWSYEDSPIALPTGPAAPDYILLIAAAVFILGAVTDALDGFLARKWGVVSVFGRIMDPFADKLLVIGAFVFLAGPGFASVDTAKTAGGQTIQFGLRAFTVSHVAPWMVAVILGRELLVSSIRADFESRGISFAAGPSGKIKMVLQSLAVPLILVLMNIPAAEPPHIPGPIYYTIAAVTWTTLIATVWSGLPYITRAIRASRN